MRIKGLFKRDIFRPINGVVKADQLDSASVWQELDEFVVTAELRKHINRLVNVLLSTIEGEVDAAEKNGVWVSGFFGCGKSHFIKVLSYLLNNEEHHYDGKSRKAVDFFEDKFADTVLFADVKKVVAVPTDTILFNIDSKADPRDGRYALLRVFLRVLNEKQGYSGDHPHIAHMERHLDEIGKLAVFHEAFKREAGEAWVDERDAWEFHRDEVVAALSEALGQSEVSVEAWVDGGESNFSLTVENFAKWVKHYLDSQGPDHRIMFLVDEVGQFIGNDTHLMLNLQTITEQLGTVCAGRAWVVVTSQEDLDAVLGDLKNHKQHDFSKIQGRFKTRLSLSSNNVDEVIKERLLAKKDEAAAPLGTAYEGKHDILRNQLSFTNAGMSFKAYRDGGDFAACYPFAAYQFSLVQKVFESIRKAGATGLHLSQGERSTLDAFQSAAKHVGQKDVGALVPFHLFYPAVEGFLDTAVKRTIDQASGHHTLKPFDSTLLKVMFLIRYIDELPGSVDNLVTLCVEEIDADRLSIRREIEASLARLEKETLISRNGDLYFFLTNEERDIGREIKNHPVPSGAEERELGKLLFEDILGDIRKHSYSETGRDFSFTRLCDDHPVGNRLDGSIEVAFVSPVGDTYGDFSTDEGCSMHTMHEQSRVLIRLPDDANLGRELRTYLQTESYVKTKHTGALPETTRRILRDLSEDNRGRRERIVTVLTTMLASADYFASSKKLAIKSEAPKAALGEALEYLIKNAYPKMAYIEHLHSNPKQEIQSILRADDVERVTLGVSSTETNLKALNDVREYVRLCAQTSKQIILYELVEKRYGQQPYGWPELEVVLLVARLAVLKEVTLIVNGAPLSLDQAYEHLVSPSKQRKVVVRLRKVADKAILKTAQALGKDLFEQLGPAGQDPLFEFLKGKLESWRGNLARYEPLAKTGEYPGLGEIKTGLAELRKFVEERDSLRFLNRFVENKTELQDLADDFQDLSEFYSNQRHTWKSLRNAVNQLAQNRLQLEGDAEAGPALRRMEEILGSKAPYGMLHEVAALSHTATTANDAIVQDSRIPIVQEIQGLLEEVNNALGQISSSASLTASATAGLKKLLAAAESTTSIAHLMQARLQAQASYNSAMKAIDEAPRPKTPDPKPPKPKLKRRRFVDPKLFCSGPVIETEQQIEDFLAKLRSELEAAIKAGDRVQLK